jgi:hypothetical protein
MYKPRQSVNTHLWQEKKQHTLTLPPQHIHTHKLCTKRSHTHMCILCIIGCTLWELVFQEMGMGQDFLWGESGEWISTPLIVNVSQIQANWIQFKNLFVLPASANFTSYWLFPVHSCFLTGRVSILIYSLDWLMSWKQLIVPLDESPKAQWRGVSCPATRCLLGRIVRGQNVQGRAVQIPGTFLLITTRIHTWYT